MREAPGGRGTEITSVPCFSEITSVPCFSPVSRPLFLPCFSRKGISGRVYVAGERLSIPEAIAGYTRNGAYLTFEEDVKGTIAPGMLADMVVLSKNLLEIDPEEILSTQVVMTVLWGRIVYRASPF